MRLIDADRLKRHYAWWGDDDSRKRVFDEIVDYQPTVDPERHGVWMDADGCISICSECGAIGCRTSYCSCCGAKMGGVE